MQLPGLEPEYELNVIGDGEQAVDCQKSEKNQKHQINPMGDEFLTLQ